MDKHITPLPEYPEPVGLLAAVLQDSTEEWRGELPAELPPEVMTWRIRPEGQSMGAVILHMIAAELAWTEGFLLDQPVSDQDKAVLLWDEIDVDECLWATLPPNPSPGITLSKTNTGPAPFNPSNTGPPPTLWCKAPAENSPPPGSSDT